MLIRFPLLSDNISNTHFLRSEDIPFAKHKHETNQEKKSIFLTENTLIFVLKGTKVFHFNNNKVNISASNLILLKKGIYILSEFIPDEPEFEALILFFSDKFLKEFALKYKLDSPSPAGEVDYLSLPITKQLENFRTQYLSYFGIEMPHLESILSIKLYELFLLLISGNHAGKVADFINSIIDPAQIDIEYVVRNNLFQPITVPEYAKLSGRSLTSFKRDFTKKFNVPPKKWINTQRLAYAEIMLKKTNKSVAEISFECGFENVSHFIRIFKKEFGITPNIYRTNKAIN